MRIRTLLENKLPYDAEIEYLESTGIQYLNTGIYITRYPIKIETKVYFNSSSPAEQDVFGNYYQQNNLCIIVGKYNSTFHLWYGYRWQPASLSTQRWYTLSFEAKTSSSVEMIINGNRYTNNNVALNATSSESPIYIFNVGYKKQSPLYGRVGYTKIYDNNVLVRDFIPVRVGQTGYMYDKVSGQLFGNSGTGSFILGPDI